VTDPIADELQLIRNNVPGVRGSITATSDGLLVAREVARVAGQTAALRELPEPGKYLAQDVRRRRLAGAAGSLPRQVVLRLVTHWQALPVRLGRAGTAGFL
jgi:hypothetical protein